MRHTANVVISDGAIVSRGGAEAGVPWWSFTKTVIAAAAFSPGEDQGLVERRCVLSLTTRPAKEQP